MSACENAFFLRHFNLYIHLHTYTRMLPKPINLKQYTRILPKPINLKKGTVKPTGQPQTKHFKV